MRGLGLGRPVVELANTPLPPPLPPSATTTAGIVVNAVAPDLATAPGLRLTVLNDSSTDIDNTSISLG